MLFSIVATSAVAVAVSSQVSLIPHPSKAGGLLMCNWSTTNSVTEVRGEKKTKHKAYKKLKGMSVEDNINSLSFVSKPTLLLVFQGTVLILLTQSTSLVFNRKAKV